MIRARRLGTAALAALLACACAGACSGKGATTVGTGGSADGSARASCNDIRAKVEQLYRAEAEAKEPKRVEEAVADNTTMVMNDCAREPARVIPCVTSVSSVADLEQKCLAALDEEGSEGELLRK
jgi:hypothetical protein